MVSLQLLNKIIQDKNFDLIEKNELSEDYFTGYEKEYNFIKSHYKKYKKVPDILTILDKFPEFQQVEVKESERYLIDKIREEHLYNTSVPILQKAAALYNEDANKAVNYLLTNFKNIKPNYGVAGVDIIKDATNRLQIVKDKQNNKEKYYFKTGFDELDMVIHGLQRGEELVVILARTNQGKSWISQKLAISVWEQGYNVGYMSPEMSAQSIGFRFDVLYKNFSSNELFNGEKFEDENKYKNYLKTLSYHKNKFLVTTPSDFNNHVTVSALKNWIITNDLHMIVVDGLTYLKDERYTRGDNITTMLTHISEDLMSLSIELKIPIVAVVQANREATGEDKTGAPEIETVRGSDGIAFNASKLLSIRNKSGTLEISVKKQRNGSVGNKLLYAWDIEHGQFIYIPNPKADLPDGQNEVLATELKNKFENDIDDVF